MGRGRTTSFLVALSLQAAPTARAPDDEHGSMAATIAALEALGNRSTHEKQWEAARWIAASFSELGLAVTLPTYEYQGKTWPNVVATLEGRERRAELILSIAHLDSRAGGGASAAPGADDNASGVAVLLEVARQLRGKALARTVEFVVFSNEEAGAAGSRAFARVARASGVHIAAVVNFDAVGYPGPSFADWSALAGVGSLRARLKALKTMAANLVRSLSAQRLTIQVAARPTGAALVAAVASQLDGDPRLHVLRAVREDCGCGDEGSFWSEGYAAVYVTSRFQSPFQHSSQDRRRALDPEMLAAVARGAQASIELLSSSDWEPRPVPAGSESGAKGP